MRILCILILTTSAVQAEPTKINSIAELWAGFDPHAVPLDVEVVKSWDEGDIHLESVYFTGEVFEGEKTRIFGYIGRPKGTKEKLPALVHVHGGGQTAILDWPRFWAKRGYVCLSFDFCGNTNAPEFGAGYKREHYTRWGKVPADMLRIGAGIQMKPTPRHNPWFHWTLAARRGLTLLESLPQVDKEKLGVFGISVGGTLTWSIAALDKRVKAAAPIYGCGWEFYQYPPDLYPPDLKTDPGEELRLWRTLIAPEAHAAQIECPIFLLSATNDGHARMDLAFRTLDRVPSRVKGQVFTANSDHHVEPEEAASLPLFMDTHLKGHKVPWPKSPAIQLLSRGGFATVKISPDQAAQVKQVDIFYCLNNDWPTGRFWRKLDVVEHEKEVYFGKAEYLAASDRIFAFANVTYRSGVRVSSRLLSVAVAEIAGTKPSLKRESLIDAMDTDRDWNWIPAYTDPCRDDRFFSAWKGADGERGFTLDPKTFGRGGAMIFYFGTRKIGDPQFRRPGEGALLIDHLATNIPEKVTVRLANRPPGENPMEFTTTLEKPTGEGTWKTYRMLPKQFKDASGKALPGWDNVEQIILNGTTFPGKEPVFKRLRWEEK